MPKDSESFNRLTVQFKTLAESLKEVPNLKKRKQLLRRMKILIDEIDGLISSDLMQDAQDSVSSGPRPTEPRQGPEKPTSGNVVARWK